MVAYTTTWLPWWRPRPEVEAEIGEDRLGRVPPRGHRDARSWVAPRAAQVDVLYRGAVVSHLGYGAHRARLVGQHRAVADGPMHGAAQLPLQVERRMGLPLQQLLFQVRYVVSGDPVDQVVGVGFLRRVPVPLPDMPGGVAPDLVGHAKHDELLQVLALGSPARVYHRVVPGSPRGVWPAALPRGTRPRPWPRESNDGGVRCTWQAAPASGPALYSTGPSRAA